MTSTAARERAFRFLQIGTAAVAAILLAFPIPDTLIAISNRPEWFLEPRPL